MASSVIDITQEQQVADYLTQHPDFFDRHPTTLATLTLQHKTEGAISLVERQLRQFREQNQTYRTKLDALLQVARTNATIDQRLHKLTLSLMNIGAQDDIISLLCHQVQAALDADAVSIKLFTTPVIQPSDAQSILSKLDPFFQQNTPCCGVLPTAQADYLFGDLTVTMGSAALIPLQSTHMIGLLAIGDQDPSRFHAEQGVDFLQRLADVLQAVLHRIAA